MKQKEEKEADEENMKKIRQTLKAHISVMAGLIQPKFGIRGNLPPNKTSAAKLVNFRSGTTELQMHENSLFLVPVKYTLVCRTSALAILDHMTHYRVS